jgi:deoxyribonucleoside regulator
MIDPKKLELIIEAVHLYYEKGHTQKEIADILNCSVATVSRLLKEAQEVGVVEIVIKYPYAVIPSLGQELRQKYNLLNAYVFPTTGVTYYDLVQTLGHTASIILDEYLTDNTTLGISLGLSVSATIRAFKGRPRRGCKIVRLQGAVDSEIMEGTNLSQILASKIGAEAITIPSPWLLPNEELRNTMLREASVAQTLQIAAHADIGLVGMGTMEPSYSTILRNKLITLRELNEIRAMGAVGEICGQHYDINGNLIDHPFQRRIVAVSLESLRNFQCVIGVAAGIHKVDPLIGAINGGFINVVVTDSDAAREMLDRAG